MQTSLAAVPTTNGNDIVMSIEIEIEELEAITAPEATVRVILNQNETFVCDESVEVGAD